MKMRNIIPLVTGGTLLATLFGGSTLHAATKSKPNLVLVLVDDMGWGAFAPNHVDFTEKELNQEFAEYMSRTILPKRLLKQRKSDSLSESLLSRGSSIYQCLCNGQCQCPFACRVVNIFLSAAIWIIYYKRSRNRNSNNGTYYASGYERLWLCERGFWKVS